MGRRAVPCLHVNGSGMAGEEKEALRRIVSPQMRSIARFTSPQTRGAALLRRNDGATLGQHSKPLNIFPLRQSERDRYDAAGPVREPRTIEIHKSMCVLVT